MRAREWLIDIHAHIPPAQALEGLDTRDAERTLEGAPHSIAEIVAHLAFWQEWFTSRCAGEPVPMAPQAAVGWPRVEPDTWPDVRDRFLSGVDRLVALAEQRADLDARLPAPIEFPPLGEYTVRDAVLHVAQHNSHHVGQIVLLRQLAGQWPPPAGSWTW